MSSRPLPGRFRPPDPSESPGRSGRPGPPPDASAVGETESRQRVPGVDRVLDAEGRMGPETGSEDRDAADGFELSVLSRSARLGNRYSRIVRRSSSVRRRLLVSSSGTACSGFASRARRARFAASRSAARCFWSSSRSRTLLQRDLGSFRSGMQPPRQRARDRGSVHRVQRRQRAAHSVVREGQEV